MQDFFSHGSPFFSHPRLNSENTAREIDFLVHALALRPETRILDVGCGFGRHSIELARRGYQVVGIDPATAMIEAARQRATEARVSVTFQQVAAEDFVDAEPFDAAICLFTTLGQIPAHSHTDNRELLSVVAHVLKADGSFALELPQKGPALAALKPSERFGNEPDYMKVERSYADETDSVTEQFHLISPTATRTYTLRYRLFNRQDVTRLLAKAGLQVRSTYAGYTTAELTDQGPLMLFVCTRCISTG